MTQRRLMFKQANEQAVLKAQQLLDIVNLTTGCLEKFGDLVYHYHENKNNIRKNKQFISKLKNYNMKCVGVLSSFEILCDGQNKTREGTSALKIASAKFYNSLETLKKKYNNNPVIVSELLAFYESILLIIQGKEMNDLPNFKVENFNNKMLSDNMKKFTMMQQQVEERNQHILKNFEKYSQDQNRELNTEKTQKNLKKLKNHKFDQNNQSISKLYRYVEDDIDHDYEKRQNNRDKHNQNNKNKFCNHKNTNNYERDDYNDDYNDNNNHNSSDEQNNDSFPGDVLMDGCPDLH